MEGVLSKIIEVFYERIRDSLGFQEVKADKKNTIRDILNFPTNGTTCFRGKELRAHEFCFLVFLVLNEILMLLQLSVKYYLCSYLTVIF
ncbi:transmembrane protein, putative [Medicago truncatula]|uniref:Transmembrane protein, putative n=1 Tax=Medicago truncatula TaxID=3880 RepID=G7JGD2_MEDTR|nr:transmembrane protein, putative [Medicago truncatula]